MGRLKKRLLGIVAEDGFSAGIFHTSAAAGRERPVAIMVGAAHPTFLQVVLKAP